MRDVKIYRSIVEIKGIYSDVQNLIDYLREKNNSGVEIIAPDPEFYGLAQRFEAEDFSKTGR